MEVVVTDNALIQHALAFLQRLPRNLLEAIEILRNDDFSKTTIGEQIHNSYLQYKVDEWERYHQTMTDWEVEEYLRLY